MTEGVRNFLIGLAVLVAVIGLGGLLLMFGELEAWTTRRYEVTINMNSASGLQVGSAVELNGIRIGVVHRVQHQDIARYPVRITARIDSDVTIPEGADAAIERQLIGGAAMLHFTSHHLPPDEPLTYVPTDGTAEFWIFERTMLEQVAAEIDVRIQPMLETLVHVNRLADTFTTVGEHLTALLQPYRADDSDSAETLHTAVQRLNAMLASADRAMTAAGDWLTDEQLREEISAVVAGAARVMDEASAMIESVSGAAARIEEGVDELIVRLLPAADEFAATLDDVRQVAQLAAEGSGTIGQLLTNPDLYNSLHDAAVRLEQALLEAQLLMQQIQAEGLRMRPF
jgi:phospholipid/cholesterol/gamma-HCH transport system substrate-binding protein